MLTVISSELPVPISVAFIGQGIGTVTGGCIDVPRRQGPVGKVRVGVVVDLATAAVHADASTSLASARSRRASAA